MMINITDRRYLSIGFLLLIVFSFTNPVKKPTTFNITFLHKANGQLVILRDSTYLNSFGEAYTVSKLKYYISNVSLLGNDNYHEKDSYHLVDIARSTSFKLNAPNGKYHSIRFLVGVDSLRNCSGAQQGALDPLNDMFWTWNSGYVMFKLEGKSSASGSDLNRIEHHIGGYKSPFKTMQEIELPLESIIKSESPNELFILMDMDRYWDGVHKVSIKELPINTFPGEKAKRMSENFKGMFSITKPLH